MTVSPTARSVFLSTSPADNFGAFTDPELIFCADEIDRENGRRRVSKLLADPKMLSPPIIDDIDYISGAAFHCISFCFRCLSLHHRCCLSLHCLPSSQAFTACHCTHYTHKFKLAP